MTEEYSDSRLLVAEGFELLGRRLDAIDRDLMSLFRRIDALDRDVQQMHAIITGWKKDQA